MHIIYSLMLIAISLILTMSIYILFRKAEANRIVSMLIAIITWILFFMMPTIGLFTSNNTLN